MAKSDEPKTFHGREVIETKTGNARTVVTETDRTKEPNKGSTDRVIQTEKGHTTLHGDGTVNNHGGHKWTCLTYLENRMTIFQWSLLIYIIKRDFIF